MVSFHFALKRCFDFAKEIGRGLTYPMFLIKFLLGYGIDKYFLFGDNIKHDKRRGKIIRSHLKSCGENLTVAVGVTIGDPQNTIIGNNVHIGFWTYLGVGPIILGDHVTIGPQCSITAHNHNYSKAGPIIIGEHTWVGAGVSIVAGVKTGKWNVIAAGAVVTKDTEDCALMAGVPARMIGKVEPNSARIIKEDKV
ncbi:acyltransferase [Thermodesulfobacteriota bacterium]